MFFFHALLFFLLGTSVFAFPVPPTSEMGDVAPAVHSHEADSEDNQSWKTQIPATHAGLWYRAISHMVNRLSNLTEFLSSHTNTTQELSKTAGWNVMDLNNEGYITFYRLGSVPGQYDKEKSLALTHADSGLLPGI